jgi:hypothetical protein
MNHLHIICLLIIELKPIYHPLLDVTNWINIFNNNDNDDMFTKITIL